MLLSGLQHPKNTTPLKAYRGNCLCQYLLKDTCIQMSKVKQQELCRSQLQCLQSPSGDQWCSMLSSLLSVTHSLLAQMHVFADLPCYQQLTSLIDLISDTFFRIYGSDHCEILLRFHSMRLCIVHQLSSKPPVTFLRTSSFT